MSGESRLLGGRIKALLVARQLVIVVALCGVALARLSQGEPTLGFSGPYVVLILACCANLIYLIIFRHTSRLELLAGSQVAIDILLVSCLVYFTGGADSPFTALFFACVLSAAVIAGTKWALAMAGISSLLLCAITVLYQAWITGRLPGLFLVAPDVRTRVSPNFFATLSFLLQESGAFVMVGVLGGTLAARLTGSRQLTDAILQNMSEGVLVVDNQGRVVYMNPRARSLLEFDALMPTGLAVDKVLGAEAHRELGQIVSRRAPCARELNLPRKNAEAVPLFVSTRFLTGRHDVPELLIVMLHDLTDQHRIKQVEKKMAQLEVVRQMASSIAHEIRNPLTAIRGSAQKLTDLSLEAKDTQLLELIMNESDRLNQIVTEFLHFARPRRLRPRRTSIRQLAEDVVLLLRQQTHEKLPEIVLDISPGESAGIDYDQMLQVFLNLGLNACQAMPEGGTLTISARSPADGQDRMRIEFADTGVGIAPEHREKLFNPFFTTKSRGTGLGLAVVERIVAAHGGWIEIGSEIGRGTKVTLWIPKEIPAAVLAEGIA